MNNLQVVELALRTQGPVRHGHLSHSSSRSRSTKHSHHRRKSGQTFRILSVILIAITVITTFTLIPRAQGLSQSDVVAAALGWLSSHELSDGSYGGFTEPQTAPATYALWITYLDSPKVLLSFSWLKNQLQNSSTWFWGGGGNIPEADIPGEILYSFARTNNLQMLNLLSAVAFNLTSQFQQSTGGFIGYVDNSGKRVQSSVDTAMALLGLVSAHQMAASNETAAVNYLFTLQKPDGSFNLTKSTSFNTLYSLGPEPISITALVLLALNAASVPRNDPHVISASAYLANQASTNFNGHVYAASLSLLAFSELLDANDAVTADNYILTQQNPDGGFRDTSRGSTTSTALDTGWAAVSLQIGGAFCCTIMSIGGGRRPYEM